MLRIFCECPKNGAIMVRAGQRRSKYYSENSSVQRAEARPLDDQYWIVTFDDGQWKKFKKPSPWVTDWVYVGQAEKPGTKQQPPTLKVDKTAFEKKNVVKKYTLAELLEMDDE